MTNQFNFSYPNKESELPLVHSSPSAHSYHNGSKPSHNSLDGVNDDQEDCLRYTEKDSLLPKNETRRISSSSLRYFDIFSLNTCSGFKFFSNIQFLKLYTY